MIRREAWYREAEVYDLAQEMLLRRTLGRLEKYDFDGLYSYLALGQEHFADTEAYNPEILQLINELHDFIAKVLISPYRAVYYSNTGRVDTRWTEGDLRELNAALDQWERDYLPKLRRLQDLIGVEEQYTPEFTKALALLYDLEWGLEIEEGDPSNASPNFTAWAKNTIRFIEDFMRRPTPEKMEQWQDIYQAWKSTWEDYYIALDKGTTFTVKE